MFHTVYITVMRKTVSIAFTRASAYKDNNERTLQKRLDTSRKADVSWHN